MKTTLFVVTIALLLSLTSCGPAGKLRRAEKLIKKAELQGAVWTSDTVWQERTVFVPERHLDTLVVVKLGDTVRLEKERLKLKLVRIAGDTVFVDAKCATDTIKINVPTIITKEITADCTIKWWWLVIAVVAGVIIGFILRIILRFI